MFANHHRHLYISEYKEVCDVKIVAWDFSQPSTGWFQAGQDPVSRALGEPCVSWAHNVIYFINFILFYFINFIFN